MAPTTLTPFTVANGPSRRVYRQCSQNGSPSPYQCFLNAIPNFPQHQQQKCSPVDYSRLTGTLLVVGGAGYIGSNTITVLFSKSPKLKFVVLDTLEGVGSKENNIGRNITQSNRYAFYEGNMNDKTIIDSIFANHKIDKCLVLAAYLPWQPATSEDFFNNNVSSMNNFFSNIQPYCRTVSAPHKPLEQIIFYSSRIAQLEASYVVNSANYNNKMQIPSTNYVTTKTQAVCSASYYTRALGLPINIVSPAHVFGGRNQHKNDILVGFKNILLNNQKITLSKTDVKNKDTWIDIWSVIHAHALIFLDYKHKNGYLFNLSNSSQCFTTEETAKQIIRQLKPGDDVSKWLKYTNKIGYMPDTTGISHVSNLGPCYRPRKTLQSEIDKMSSQLQGSVNTYQSFERNYDIP